jgi:hypothetical protein
LRLGVGVVELNQGEIEEIFAHTYRTCRLFPVLLIALGQLNYHNYLRDVETKILEPILTSATHKGYATQFARDFEAYGLYEAIVYLHDVDFVGDPRPLFVEIAQVYRRIAADYDANRHLLYESDDLGSRRSWRFYMNTPASNLTILRPLHCR